MKPHKRKFIKYQLLVMPPFLQQQPEDHIQKRTLRQHIVQMKDKLWTFEMA